jgi:hypothetical protein
VDSFSTTERSGAVRLAAVDPRLAEALTVTDFNITETLAGAPQLIRRYRQVRGVAQAVLYAAVDARRLGIQAPLTAELLCVAARGYLTTVQPDDTGLRQAIIDLSRADQPTPYDGTAPLIEILSSDRHTIIGYTVADYLLQHALRQRRTAAVPEATWQALTDHRHAPADLIRLASSAANRMLHSYAKPLLHRAADAGDRRAAIRLAANLYLEDLRADVGGDYSAGLLINLLAGRDDRDELRADADAGDGYAARQLADLLAWRGDLDELRTRADAGDGFAAGQLVQLLSKRGDLDALRDEVAAGVPSAGKALVGLLAKGDSRQRTDAERIRRWGLHSDGTTMQGSKDS